MKPSSVKESSRKSKNVGNNAKKQIWRIIAFILLVASLLYYVSTRKPDYYGSLKNFGVAVVDQRGTSISEREDFFTEFKLSREKMQKEQMDLIKKVMEDEKASPKVREEAHLQYLALIDAMGKELKIEGILKAKGLDSIVFLFGDSCTVVVKASKLDENEVARIGDVVRRVARIGLQNITIIPAPS